MIMTNKKGKDRNCEWKLNRTDNVIKMNKEDNFVGVGVTSMGDRGACFV